MVKISCLTLCLLPIAGTSFADNSAVTEHYADLALAAYEDSLLTAKTLMGAVDTLLEEPSVGSLQAARDAWLAARVPYQQTEVYRFGNPVVDAWEGRVNAWPLDEGLIDYVDASYGSESDVNPYYAANIISNAQVTIGGQPIDASQITPTLLSDQLQEAGGNEANVATGYHAIEFLLWGQDLNFTDAGSGNRPHTDFDLNQCTGDHCERRGEYLQAATELLVADLNEMVEHWREDGQARKALLSADESSAFSAILTGMGSLSYGELAGERMRLGLMLHDPEEEHDCFSDNTHNSHFYNALGISNVYSGNYVRVSGEESSGPSLSERVASVDSSLDNEMRTQLNETMAAMQALVDRAEDIEAYDQMIAEGNSAGNDVVQAAVDALVNQTKTIERVIAALQISGASIEGSDSLDDPDSVFQ